MQNLQTQFESWLRKKRKANGELLLTSSAETYLRISNIFFACNKDQSKFIEKMNKDLKLTKSPVHFACYKNILEFLEYPEEDMLKLKAPKFSASALTSQRILHTKVRSIEEIKAMLEYTDKYLTMKEYALLKVLYDTACRKGEIVRTPIADYENQKSDTYHGLRVCDVDFENKEATVFGKGRKKRTVALSDSTLHWLGEYIKAKGLKGKQTIFTFYKGDGKPYVRQDDECWKLIKHIGKMAIGKHVYPHCLRHTKICHWADMGADLLDLKEMAGHDNVKTTMIYVQISSWRRKEAFRKYSFDIEAV